MQFRFSFFFFLSSYSLFSLPRSYVKVNNGPENRGFYLFFFFFFPSYSFFVKNRDNIAIRDNGFNVFSFFFAGQGEDRARNNKEKRRRWRMNIEFKEVIILWRIILNRNERGESFAFIITPELEREWKIQTDCYLLTLAGCSRQSGVGLGVIINSRIFTSRCSRYLHESYIYSALRGV